MAQNQDLFIIIEKEMLLNFDLGEQIFQKKLQENQEIKLFKRFILDNSKQIQNKEKYNQRMKNYKLKAESIKVQKLKSFQTQQKFVSQNQGCEQSRKELEFNSETIQYVCLSINEFSCLKGSPKTRMRAKSVVLTEKAANYVSALEKIKSRFLNDGKMRVYLVLGKEFMNLNVDKLGCKS